MPNWPDFRNGSFGQAYQQEGKEGIKAILQSEGNIWTEDSPPMLAWCHGAPGITLARLAAFRSLGCELARADAQVGATTTALTLGDVSNFSLCHGRGGNLETLLFASEVEDAPDYRRTALEEVAGACEQYGGGSQPWPCGTIYGIPDPSLLVGEAGVLYTLLRCTSGCQLSVLIPTSERRANSLQTTPEYRMQQRLHMEEVLPESLRVLDKIRASPVFFGRVERPICELYHRIHSLIIDQDDPVAAGLLSELTRIERVRFKLSFRHRYDAVQDYIHLLEGELMEEGGLEGRKVRLVSGTTVIQCRPDTDALRKLWASNQATSVITGALNRQKVQHVMFYPWMGQVVFRPISSLAAQLFRALQAGRSSEEVEEDLRLSSNVDYTGDLSAWIDSQFRELARSGLLEPHRGVSRVSSTDGGS